MRLFQASLVIYLLAAAFSLVLIKQQKWGTIVAQTLCITAAAAGAAGAIGQIYTGNPPLKATFFTSTLPFMVIDLRVDPLSAFFLLALSVLVIAVSLFSMGYLSHYEGHRNTGLFNFLYAAFILAMILVIVAGNGVFFLIAWEAMSLLSYFLVVFESEREENQRAGTLYIIMTHIGTAFLWIALMIMYRYTGSFDMFAASDAIPALAKNLMFICFLIGFGTKAGVIPVHIWLPYAHPAAPSNVSALMSGIMIKTALYGMIRFVLCYLQIQELWWGVLILVVGLLSAVLGVAYAYMEHNIKRLLAFCSVENIGIILIGLGISFIALAEDNQFIGSLALAAALFHTFNHTLFKGGLFLGAGAIQFATGTKDMEELGGLIKKMPGTALWVLAFSLAISAIPPFNGFISEWLTFQALFASIGPGQAGVNILLILTVAGLGLSGAMAAASFVKLFGISFLGLPRSPQAANAQEVPLTMQAGMGLLATACLIIGLCPMIFLRLIDRVVMPLVGQGAAGQLQGGLLLAVTPLQISGNSISPAGLLAVLAVMILSSLLLLRLIGGKYIVRKYGTWDCGFSGLNARTQYSATGYAKPLRIVFRILYQAGRELEIESGKSAYFPQAIKYTVTTESIFEKYLYQPVVRRLIQFSRRTKLTVQTGSIHLYLIYIFVTVLALMIYNRLV